MKNPSIKTVNVAIHVHFVFHTHTHKRQINNYKCTANMQSEDIRFANKSIKLKVIGQTQRETTITDEAKNGDTQL